MLSLKREQSKASKLKAKNASLPLQGGEKMVGETGTKSVLASPKVELQRKNSESMVPERKNKFSREYWSGEPSSGSDDEEISPGRALGLAKERRLERPLTVGRPSVIGERTLSGMRRDGDPGRSPLPHQTITSSESDEDLASPEMSGLLHTLVPKKSGSLKQLVQGINRALGQEEQEEQRRAEREADAYTASLGKRGEGATASSRLVAPMTGGLQSGVPGYAGVIGGVKYPPKLIFPTAGIGQRSHAKQNMYDITDSEDDFEDNREGVNLRDTENTTRGTHTVIAAQYDGKGSTATDTLARTIKVLGSRSTKHNPDLMADVDDSDSSDTENGERYPDTLKRIQMVHTKHAGFSLGGVDNFDSFMRAIDKSVSKTVKLEHRHGGLNQRSTLKSSPSSRFDTREGISRPFSSSNSRPVSSSGVSGGTIGSIGRADKTRGREAPLHVSEGTTSSKFVPSYIHETCTRTDPKSFPLDVRRQQFANLESPLSPGHGRMLASSCGSESRERAKLDEQMEEIEMLRIEAVKKAKLEREQQEMLQKLKRDTAKKDTKKRDNVRELEKLWEEQEMKAAQEYSQAKEIERLKAELKAREDRERAQQEELERLRKNVTERARADVEGAAAFDRLVSDKASFLIVAGEREVWSNVAEKTPGSEGSAGGDFGGGGHGWSDQMPKGDRLPPGGLLPTLSKADEFGDGGLSTSHSPAPFGATAGSIISSAGRVKGSSSRPGTGTTAASGQSVDPSWERNDSDAAKLVKIEIRKGSKPLKRDGLFVVIPDVRATVNSPRLRKEPLSGPSSPPTHGSRGPGGGQNPVHVVSAVPTKEDPGVIRARNEARKAAEQESMRRTRDARPSQIIEGEIQKQTAEAGKELWDVVEEGRRKVALRGAHKILGDTEKSRKKLTGVKSVSPRGERVVTVGRNTEMARGRGITVMDRQADIDALKDPRILAEEAEMNEAGRRERVQEEYIMQLQFEREAKLKNEEGRRKALKQLRGENREIDDIIGNSDVKELSNLQDADMLSVLREENKQKDKVAAVLRVERDRVMKLQAEREREIHQLNKQVEGASNAEAIQMMQVARLRKIQEDTKRMMEEQEAELARLKKELNNEVDNRKEARELERLRQEYHQREESQKLQREEIERERHALERSMKMQNDLEAERARIIREKADREAAERFLKNQTEKEEQELIRLNREVEERKAEVARLHALNENAKARGEQQGEMLKKQYDQLVSEKELLARQEQAVLQERIDLERLNRERQEELKKMELLVEEKLELDKTERMIRQREQNALRKKEEMERLRLREQEDRLREQLERETSKAMLLNDISKKKRQNEISDLKCQLVGITIPEDDEQDMQNPSISRLDSRSRRIEDWVSGTASGVAKSSRSRKRHNTIDGAEGAPSVAITADESALGDEITFDGSQTERSCGGVDSGDISSRGISTVWRMARHGKIRDLESLLNAENVDERDGKGNTCLHHASMHNKKRVARMLLRLKADINAQNNAGNTCLHYAFGYGYDELGDYLISKGATENILNDIGATCREVTGGGGVTARENLR